MAEWTGLYATMQAGLADTLTAVQRLKGNAKSVMENTGAAKLSATSRAMLRQGLPREYDTIGAVMRID